MAHFGAEGAQAHDGRDWSGGMEIRVWYQVSILF